MYWTLWTLRVSPLYVYRHFTLCLSPALDSIYYTLHVLDSMSIVTLCLSSIIIYVLRVEGLGYSMYLTLWTLRVSPLYVYDHLTLRLSPTLDSTTVLLLYYCSTTVLLLYYCTTIVLLLYYNCSTTVLLL